MKSLYSILLFIVLLNASCTFTETLILKEDGSGKMTLQLDASETLSFMGEGEMTESIDTLFYFKDVLREVQDSIATLPIDDQDKLKKLEDYGIKMKIDSDEKFMTYDVFIDFKTIEETQSIFDVFNEISTIGSGGGSGAQSAPKQESIKVKYTYKNNIFKRDAYISDPVLHKQEMDSLQGMEMMLGGMKYKLNYTFPYKIKSTSQPLVSFSNSMKTLQFEVDYLDYLNDPDLLDIEVILENK